MNIESLFKDNDDKEKTNEVEVKIEKNKSKKLSEKDLKLLNERENKRRQVSIYRDYIKILNENEKRPESFYNCFSIYMSNLKEPIKHFGIYISYNDMTEYFLEFSQEDQNDLSDTNESDKTNQSGKTKQINSSLKNKRIYIAQAMCIVSNYPYYSVFKYILENLYTKFKEEPELPKELYLINLVTKFKRPYNNPLKLQLFECEPFLIEKESYLPIYNLNLSKFFDILDYTDFLIITEYFLNGDKDETIIFFSEDINILYPTFFSFQTLLFPLNQVNFDFYYKNLSYDTFYLFEENMFKLVLLANIKFDFKYIKQKFKRSCLIVDLDNKSVFAYKNSDFDVFEILEKEDLIKNCKLLFVQNNSPKHILLRIIRSTIEELNKYIDKDHEVKENNTMFSSLINYFSGTKKISSFECFDYFNLNLLRRERPKEKKYSHTIRTTFFSFFIKIINNYINFTKFKFTQENNKKPILKISLDEKAFLDSVDPQFLDFYKALLENYSFYSFTQNTTIDDPNIKPFIFFEELIKVSLDPTILYFDNCFEFIDLSVEGNTSIINRNSSTGINNISSNIIFEDLVINDETIMSTFDSFSKQSILKKLNLNLGNFEEKLNHKTSYIQGQLDERIFTSFNKDKAIKYIEDLIFFEIQVFKSLLETKTLELSTEEIVLTNYILFLLIELNVFLSIKVEKIIGKFKSILRIFRKGVLIKASFLYSITYFIICNVDFLSNYENEFFTIIEHNNVPVTSYIYVKFNSKDCIYNNLLEVNLDLKKTVSYNPNSSTSLDDIYDFKKKVSVEISKMRNPMRRSNTSYENFLIDIESVSSFKSITFKVPHFKTCNDKSEYKEINKLLKTRSNSDINLTCVCKTTEDIMLDYEINGNVSSVFLCNPLGMLNSLINDLLSNMCFNISIEKYFNENKDFWILVNLVFLSSSIYNEIDKEEIFNL